MIQDVVEGWHDGVAILVAILLVVNVSAYNDYNQALQFRALNADKRNVQTEVMRGALPVLGCTPPPMKHKRMQFCYPPKRGLNLRWHRWPPVEGVHL